MNGLLVGLVVSGLIILLALAFTNPKYGTTIRGVVEDMLDAFGECCHQIFLFMEGILNKLNFEKHYKGFIVGLIIGSIF